MIVNIVRICDGFISVGPHLPGGPLQYFNDISQRTFLIKSCLFNTQTLILDAVVVSPSVAFHGSLTHHVINLRYIVLS